MKVRRKYTAHPGATFGAILRSRPMDKSDQQRIALDVHMGWQAILDGDATTAHFDSLCMAINVLDVIAEDIGAKDITQPAKDALQGIRDRYLRLKRFGADAQALKYIPPALELHDECLKACTPNQWMRALEVVAKRHGIT